MALQPFPWSLGGQSHDAIVARAMTAAVFGAPMAAVTPGVGVTTAGGAHGVVGASDLAVTQNGTPNMSVNVAAGRAVMRITNASSLTGGALTAANDATVNLAIAAADPTNPRIDLVCLEVRSAVEYSEAANDHRLTVVTGTPNAVPTVPSVAGRNVLVLAQVAVAAAATTITNANITDKRTRAAALGGTQICTSATRPSGSSLGSGLEIWETDTNRLLRYDGTGWIIMAEPPVAYTPTLTNLTLGNGTLDYKYHRSDGWIDYYGRFTLGSTSAVTGLPTISIPVASVSQVSLVYTSQFNDSGATVYPAWASINGTTLQMYALNASGTYLSVAVPSATVPFTWTTADSIDFGLRYQMTTRYS